MKNKNCSYLFNSHNFPNGKKNLITDVKGITVGEYTIHNDKRKIHTGVTSIIPTSDNIFKNKLVVSSEVLNGFGKMTGLVQLKELGTLEIPIIIIKNAENLKLERTGSYIGNKSDNIP